MKPKNVMLLGFVNRAVEYLDEHLDDSTDAKLNELRNIDFQNLKEELTRNIGTSLGTMQSTVNTLIHAGEDAFDEFLGESDDRALVDEINELFDSGLGGYDRKSSDEDELRDLLRFYNLHPGESAGVAEDIAEKTKSEAGAVKTRKRPETVPEKEPETSPGIKPDIQIEDTPSDKPAASLHPVGSVLSKKEFDALKQGDVTDEESHEKALLELLKQQDELKAKIVSEDDGTPFPMSVEDSKLFDQIASRVSNSGNATRKDASDLDEIFSEVIANRPPLAHETPKDQSFSKKVEKNDIIEMVKEMQDSREKNFGALPKVPPLDSEQGSAENDKVYVSSLIADLKERMIREDEKKKQFEEEYRQVFDKIHAIYPHLDSGFIRSVYNLKDTIAIDYPNDVKIIVLHRIRFKDIERLRQFVEIALKHNYSINADEKQMIVDVFKQHVNTDGKIITSIFEVANQGAYLSGEYEGYRVILENEEEK